MTILSLINSFLFSSGTASNDKIPWQEIAQSEENWFDFRHRRISDPTFGYVNPGREITIDLTDNPCPGKFDLPNVTLITQLPCLTFHSNMPQEELDELYADGYVDLLNHYLVVALQEDGTYLACYVNNEKDIVPFLVSFPTEACIYTYYRT
jgi:hypothetical protein